MLSFALVNIVFFFFVVTNVESSAESEPVSRLFELFPNLEHHEGQHHSLYFTMLDSEENQKLTSNDAVWKTSLKEGHFSFYAVWILSNQRDISECVVLCCMIEALDSLDTIETLNAGCL